MPTPKPKAHKLPTSTRFELAKRYISLKEKCGTSYTAIAAMYHCTPEQVRAAVADYHAGRFAGRRSTRSRSKKVDAVVDGVGSSAAQLRRAIRHTIAELEQTRLEPIERVQMIEKLTKAERELQRIELQDHMRRIDSEIYARTVRRFVPDATDQDVVKIYREEEALCKTSHI
jgi:hypothetical protein